MCEYKNRHKRKMQTPQQMHRKSQRPPRNTKQKMEPNNPPLPRIPNPPRTERGQFKIQRKHKRNDTYPESLQNRTIPQRLLQGVHHPPTTHNSPDNKSGKNSNVQRLTNLNLYRRVMHKQRQNNSPCRKRHMVRRKRSQKRKPKSTLPNPIKPDRGIICHLLSRRKYILYTTQYSNLTSWWRGERLLGLLLLLTIVGENKKCYSYTVESTWYI